MAETIVLSLGESGVTLPDIDARAYIEPSDAGDVSGLVLTPVAAGVGAGEEYILSGLEAAEDGIARALLTTHNGIGRAHFYPTVTYRTRVVVPAPAADVERVAVYVDGQLDTTATPTATDIAGTDDSWLGPIPAYSYPREVLVVYDAAGLSFHAQWIQLPAPFATPVVGLSRLDKMAVVCRELFAADAVLGAWADSVVRTHYPTWVPGLPCPYIAVAVGQRDYPIEPGECRRLAGEIHFGIAWEQPRDLMDNSESSVDALFSRMVAILRQNQTLQHPVYGGEVLAERLQEIQPVSFIDLQNPEDESTVVYWKSMVADYRIAIDRSTWEVK